MEKADGTYSATPNSDSRVLIADTNVTTNCTGRVRNTTMYCQRFVADSGTAIGIEAGGLTGLDPSNIQIENVTVIAQLLQSGASGAAYCIKRSKLNSDDVLAATIKGGALYASKVSGGTIAHIDANSTGSVVLADGLSYDRTQCTNSAANITDTPLNASTAATQSTAAAADLPVKLKKNVSFPGFKFKLEKSNGDPATGKTVTAQRLIDSGSFANCTNAVSEKSGGWYIIDLSAADLNGDCIALKFTASGANQRDMMIVTQ